MDPANVDRRRGLLVGISDASLKVRSMVIAGVTGKIDQKILSTTLQGESTRLIKAPAQWRTESRGHFTASFDLLVISGELQINGINVKPNTLLRVDRDSLVFEFSCVTPITALLCAEGPLKFELGDPETDKKIIIGNTFVDDNDPKSNTLSSYCLSKVNSPRQFWIQRWGSDTDIHVSDWQSRTTSEECFVLRGAIDVGTSVNGNEQRFIYDVGGYYSLPPKVSKQSSEIRSKGPTLTVHICPVNSQLIESATG
jgi:hypothetical protein